MVAHTTSPHCPLAACSTACPVCTKQYRATVTAELHKFFGVAKKETALPARWPAAAVYTLHLPVLFPFPGLACQPLPREGAVLLAQRHLC